jgi:hypothetical protein
MSCTNNERKKVGTTTLGDEQEIVAISGEALRKPDSQFWENTPSVFFFPLSHNKCLTWNQQRHSV